MQQKIFRNIQPNDEFQVVKTGEYFKVIERSTYYCGNCECKPLQPCNKFKEMSSIVVISNKGKWSFSLKEINAKFDNNDLRWI
tara:strand:- start:734 stop:982 length:249 start_codon:yes stop_codon:yes gene_type:complete